MKRKILHPPVYIPVAGMALGTLAADAMASTPNPPGWANWAAGIVWILGFGYAAVTLPIKFMDFLKSHEEGGS